MSSNTNPTSLQARVDQAAKVMGITPDAAWQLLGELGIEKDSPDALSLLEAETTTEGDARRYFVDPGKVKIARFKAGWSILKGKGSDASPKDASIGDLIKSMRTPAQMSDEELLNAYGPDCPATVCDELQKRSQGRAFIVFDGEKVNVAGSSILLKMSRTRETPADYPVNGKTVRTFRVGEFPMLWIEECPIHRDVVLANGYCEKCGQDWSVVPNDDRVAVRVAVNMAAVGADTLADIAKIVAGVQEKGSAYVLGIGKVRLEYDELAEEHELPVLRHRFSSRHNGKACPFYSR